MKRLLYLVQGRSDLVETYFHLAERKDADAIFLTYDKEIDNAIYFPDSTWSEGRNKLLECARTKGEYEYYICCDDDIKFRMGSWDEFEKLLFKYRPAIGYPVFIPKAKKTPIPYMESQLYCIIDQQLIALHRDLIEDAIIVPYQYKLDEFSWWVSGSIANLIIKNFYDTDALQFNNVRVLNTEHGRYDSTNNRQYYDYSMDWFKKECRNGFKEFLEVKYFKKSDKYKLAFRSLIYALIRNLRSKDYKIDRKELSNFFNDDSVFLKQYDALNSKD